MSQANESICNEYHTTLGVNASTTGNIYGIYDMSGGASEMVAAYVDNTSSLYFKGTQIMEADLKYKDVYKVGAKESQSTN